MIAEITDDRIVKGLFAVFQDRRLAVLSLKLSNGAQSNMRRELLVEYIKQLSCI
jgi:hypothetical protein